METGKAFCLGRDRSEAIGPIVAPCVKTDAGWLDVDSQAIDVPFQYQ